MIDADIRVDEPGWGSEAELEKLVADALAVAQAELGSEKSGVDLASPDAPQHEMLPRRSGAALHSDSLRASSASLRAAQHPGKNNSYEIAILLTDDAAQRILNREHRAIDKPTNVLSFPAGDAPLPPGIPRPLGDLSLAYQTVAREAQENGAGMSAHLQHLIIHGFLHLLGYDHENDTEASIMEATETRALARLGIADPYGAQQV